MAEGIARHLGHEAASAGTHPARQVSAHALTILAAKGIDTSTLNPKSVDLFNAEDFDMVISCLLYTSPSPRDRQKSRMPSSA